MAADSTYNGAKVHHDGPDKLVVEPGGYIDIATQAGVTKTANYTLAAADVGKCVDCATDGVVFTLPATVIGYSFRVRNTSTALGAVGITLSPNAADKIMGVGLTAADDKDLVNTKATARPGDEVLLVADGVDGWYVHRLVGTWAREA